MYDVNFLISNGVDVNKSLELFGDIDTYNETVGEFLVSAKEKIAKLQKYKDDKDMPNYAIYVHSLKSDAKYFGFTKLADLAYDQELKSKEGDMFYIYEHYQELIDEVERTINIVEKLSSDIEKKVQKLNIADKEIIKIFNNTFSLTSVVVNNFIKITNIQKNMVKRNVDTINSVLNQVNK